MTHYTDVHVGIYRQKGGGYWLILNRPDEVLPPAVAKRWARNKQLGCQLYWVPTSSLIVYWDQRARAWPTVKTKAQPTASGALRLYIPKRLDMALLANAPHRYNASIAIELTGRSNMEVYLNQPAVQPLVEKNDDDQSASAGKRGRPVKSRPDR